MDFSTGNLPLQKVREFPDKVIFYASSQSTLRILLNSMWSRWSLEKKSEKSENGRGEKTHD